MNTRIIMDAPQIFFQNSEKKSLTKERQGGCRGGKEEKDGEKTGGKTGNQNEKQRNRQQTIPPTRLCAFPFSFPFL